MTWYARFQQYYCFAPICHYEWSFPDRNFYICLVHRYDLWEFFSTYSIFVCHHFLSYVEHSLIGHLNLPVALRVP